MQIECRHVSGRRNYSVHVDAIEPVRLVCGSDIEHKAERGGLPVFGSLVSIIGSKLEIRHEDGRVTMISGAYALAANDDLWLVPRDGSRRSHLMIVEGFAP